MRFPQFSGHVERTVLCLNPEVSRWSGHISHQEENSANQGKEYHAKKQEVMIEVEMQELTDEQKESWIDFLAEILSKSSEPADSRCLLPATILDSQRAATTSSGRHSIERGQTLQPVPCTGNRKGSTSAVTSSCNS